MDRQTRALFDGRFAARLPHDIRRVAQRKPRQFHGAQELAALAAPPGNRLERLHAGRAGQHSIRINNQWRICFAWPGNGADQVEIANYHRE